MGIKKKKQEINIFHCHFSSSFPLHSVHFTKEQGKGTETGPGLTVPLGTAGTLPGAHENVINVALKSPGAQAVQVKLPHF